MIRGLEGYFQDTKLLQTSQLSLLKDTRLGIDLSYYLRQLLANDEVSEPLAAAIGAQPQAFLSRIERDLRVLDQHRIRPVFVLNGLSPTKRTRPFSYEDRRPGLRQRAWEAYEAGDVDLAIKHLRASNSIHFHDLYRMVLRMFRHKHVEFLVAPYLATGQLAVMEAHSKQYVHAIYGPTELLTFQKINMVILQIDFARSSFQYVSKQAILRELHCTESQFLDIALILGMEYCSTFPALQDESTKLLRSPARPNVVEVNKLVQQHQSGYALCNRFAEHRAVVSSGYIDQYCHARTMIKNCLVLAPVSTTVLPLPLVLGQHDKELDEIPSGLHEIFSPRFPEEVYLCLSRGLFHSSVMGSLSSGYMVEPAPLDNGETVEYQRFVREYLAEMPQSPRCVAIALACSVLHPFWRSRKVAAVYYFQPQIEYPVMHESPATQQLLQKIESWYVPSTVLDAELKRQNSATIDLMLCLNTTADATRAQRTIGPRDASAGLSKKDELVANSLWRFLELRGFLNGEHTHSALGRALHIALHDVKINDRVQESLFFAMELLHAGILHGKLYSEKEYSGGPSLGTQEEMQHMRLVMRVMSLVCMAFKPKPWDAPLSRELLVFNSFVKTLSRSLRSLVEMVLFSMLLRSENRVPREDYLDLSLSLMFQSDVNTGLGIVVKCYLDALYTLNGGTIQAQDADSSSVQETKDSVIEMLDETFDNVRNVRLELQRGFRFWSALVKAVQSLAQDKVIDAEIAQQFQAADTWLKPMML
ncbi:hypothetical protein MYAM1_002494 [Malassezia yamatoensis]|uniref:XPG N-terminal domain-containing protein n=1 Tax=Malassezia yamatoensis TaxID=253288 RepID=A0AAJ6CHC4_9BASI|nr:hypothetical protein MYAM1_002494 [Malassezia yamatoensis]